MGKRTSHRAVVCSGVCALAFLWGCGAAAPRPQKLVTADKLLENEREHAEMSKVAGGLLLEAKKLHGKAVEAYEDEEMAQAEYYAELAALTYHTGQERVRIRSASKRLTDAETRLEEARGANAEAEEKIAELKPHVERMEKLAKAGNKEQQLRKELEEQQARIKAEQKKGEVRNILALVSGKLDTAAALNAEKYASDKVKDAQAKRDEAKGVLEKDPAKAQELLTAADSSITAAIVTAREAFAKETAKLDLLRERKELLDQTGALGDLEAVQTDRGVVVTVRQLFSGGKSGVSASREEMLKGLATIAGKYATYPILVHGYTDSRGRNEANLALSTARAQSVESFLIQHGVAPTRLKASGYGEAEPIGDNRKKAGRAKNRRVEIIFVFP